MTNRYIRRPKWQRTRGGSKQSKHKLRKQRQRAQRRVLVSSQIPTEVHNTVKMVSIRPRARTLVECSSGEFAVERKRRSFASHKERSSELFLASVSPHREQSKTSHALRRVS